MADWLPKNDKILDCGCGRGEYVRALRRSGFDAQGIEYLETKIEECRDDAELWPHVQQGDIERLPFPDSCFGGVILNEVLEHVPNEVAALQEIFRVAREGGRLMVFSPNRRYPFESHGAALRRFDWSVPRWIPLIPWIPVAVASCFLKFWARNYWPGELRKRVESVGFSVIHLDFVWQTFEGIGGRQPALIRALRPVLISVADRLERVRLVRSFGISQLLVCEKASFVHSNHSA